MFKGNKAILLVIIIMIASALIYFYNTRNEETKVVSTEIFSGTGYVAVDPTKFEVSSFADSLVAPTRVKITPDGKFLLASQITGEVLAFTRTSNGWNSEPKELLKVETRFPGFPPDEAGFVGMIFSVDYTENGKLFLLYTYKDENGQIQNRISMTMLSAKNGDLKASTPEQIYQANTPGNVAHQITDGISLSVLGKSHLMVLIGEGFVANKAQDAKLEAGKVILIQEDGSDPLGARPYSENPKILALGIRNAYVLAENPFDSNSRVAIGDTGPDKYDRIIYTSLVDTEGKAREPLNFGWDGSQENLKKPIPDPNELRVADMVISRLEDALTFTGLAFHPGKGAIPSSNQQKQSVLVTIFGKSGSKENEPGKEVWLGRLTNLSRQPKISFESIVKRNPDAEGKLGNPIGLEIDGQTGDFFFADILEGKIYQVKIK
jgi:hypothetical protein